MNWKTEESQNQNKRPKERTSSHGKQKKGCPNIFQLCSFQVCGRFITTTWDCNSPKEARNPVQELQWKTLLMALEVTPRSAQADLLMWGWSHDQELSDDVSMYTNACVSVSFGGGSKGVVYAFVYVSVHWQLTDPPVLCEVQEVKKSQSWEDASAGTGCLHSSAPTSHKQMTWQRCMHYIFHFCCYNIRLLYSVLLTHLIWIIMKNGTSVRRM